jgi:pimeloyl-ACP methyl ester carboxylesterase
MQALRIRRTPELTLRLHDGRLLGYAEYGDPEGRALLFMHDWPGSRFDGKPWHEAAVQLRLRLIVIERPGYGLSDYHERHRIGRWPSDLAEAATLLGIGRFALLGLSGGAPFALAAGAQLADRISWLGLVNPVAPFDAPHAARGMGFTNRLVLRLASRARWTLALPMGITGFLARRAPGILARQLNRNFPPSDKLLFARSAIRDALLESLAEAFRHGSKGAVDEGNLLTRQWGFELATVAIPVRLWHGEEDRNAPAMMGHFLAAALPNCEATFIASEGHLWPLADPARVLAAVP